MGKPEDKDTPMANVTKGKVKPMASTPNAATTGALTHTSQPVKISDIFADYGWNSRAEKNVQDMADTESAGFDGFEGNIRTSGQITAIILRNTNGKTLSGAKTDKPYEVVCGFRRFRAISDLNAKKAGVPNLPPGHILAEVRDVKTETEARILNGQENTARKNLKAPDMVFLAGGLAKSGMNQVAIAEALGITQGWVSKLLKVASLPPAVLANWRDSKPIPPVQTKDGVFELPANGPDGKTVVPEKTEPQMQALAELKGTPEEITARYIRLVKPVPSAGESDAGPSERDKVLDNVREVAALMGCMVRAGVLNNGSLDWTRVIGPKKKGYPIDSGKDDSQERMIELGDAAEDAFDREVTKGAKGAEPKNTAPSAN
jgi:ParB/RepB/Spo0J family partition protein